jgi:predicted metal-dependent hydrolase
MDGYPYEVIRSRRKSISLEISRQGRILVRAPLSMRDAEIARFVSGKEEWIRTHLEKVRQIRDQASGQRLTGEEIRALADRARREIPPRVEMFARKAGVSYGRITIRNQKSRWGSCSSRGNLNFNCLLMLAPPGVTDYVIVHELCHRIEMNHSARFWAEVERVMPDYREPRKWLRDHGSGIMARMTG